MWVKITFQRPAEPGTPMGTAAGWPFGALQCFALSCWKQGAYLTARTVYLSPSHPWTILPPSPAGQLPLSCCTHPPPPPGSLSDLCPPRGAVSAHLPNLLHWFSDRKAVSVGKSCICSPFRYRVGGQTAMPPLLPSFLFPPFKRLLWPH